MTHGRSPSRRARGRRSLRAVRHCGDCASIRSAPRSRSRSSTPTRIPRTPACARASRCRGCRASTAGWSPATTWRWRRCATPQTFTVDDPRFSTAQVIGPSMLSLDGDEHARHRAPFAGPFRPGAVSERFADVAAAEAERLVDAIAPDGRAELRRAFAGPMAAAIVTRALGLAGEEADDVLGWYDAIVASVTSITAGDGPTRGGRRGVHALRERLEEVIADPSGDSLLAAAAAAEGGAHRRPDRLQRRGAAVRRDRDDRGDDRQRGADAARSGPTQLAAARADPAALDAAIDESLRLEPAAAVIDRYATADVTLGGARDRPRRPRAPLAGRRQPRPGRVRRARRVRPRPRRAAATSPSPRARTCASACTSPGWRRAPRCTALLRPAARLRLDPERPAESAGWCSASRRG